MNRIFKLLDRTPAQPEIDMDALKPMPIPTETPAGEPKICAFCLGDLVNADFRAFSRDGYEGTACAICDSCLDKMSVMRQFSRNHRAYLPVKPDYQQIQARIGKALAGMNGTSKMKRVAWSFGIQFLKRGSALIQGIFEKAAPIESFYNSSCPKTGIPLRPARIALVGKNAAACKYLFETICREVGLIFVETNALKLASGLAFKEMIKTEALGVPHWAKIGVIFCSDFSPTNAEANVIFACETTEGLPTDFQVINVDGHDASELC